MRVYFLGICGTAMGNAALLLREMGHEVSGADANVYPPMSEVLASAGIELMEGYDAARLASLRPELTVIGNALSRGNPEVEWLLNQSELRYVSLPALLRETVLAGREPIVVTGTHGKTTTSALTAYLLWASGCEPGWLIGGVPRDLPCGARLGGGRSFVIEGDEYDSAFFDKRSKFIHYRPRIALINNLEMDHADIFRDLADVQRSFAHFLKVVPGEGRVIINGDDPNIAALMPVPWTTVLKVGTGPENDLRIEDFSDGPEGSSFALRWRGESWTRVEWALHGLFNARNAAMASLAAALADGGAGPVGFDLSALSRFQGVRRRQDVLRAGASWTVIEDFGHHPTAIAGALEALRAAHPDRRLIACFEPRSNTACSGLFQTEFEEALMAADEIYLGAIHRGERLRPEERLDRHAIGRALELAGRKAAVCESNEELQASLLKRVAQSGGGVVVFFTNGSFDGIPRRIAAAVD